MEKTLKSVGLVLIVLAVVKFAKGTSIPVLSTVANYL